MALSGSEIFPFVTSLKRTRGWQFVSLSLSLALAIDKSIKFHFCQVSR